mgnify:CR=1 FL=1
MLIPNTHIYITFPFIYKKVEWIECDRNLYGGHEKFLKIIREKMYNQKNEIYVIFKNHNQNLYNPQTHVFF